MLHPLDKPSVFHIDSCEYGYFGVFCVKLYLLEPAFCSRAARDDKLATLVACDSIQRRRLIGDILVGADQFGKF